MSYNSFHYAILSILILGSLFAGNVIGASGIFFWSLMAFICIEQMGEEIVKERINGKV